MKELQFKNGDNVTIIKDEFARRFGIKTDYIGKTATILESYATCNPNCYNEYMIGFDDKSIYMRCEHEIELLSAKTTKPISSPDLYCNCLKPQIRECNAGFNLSTKIKICDVCGKERI